MKKPMPCVRADWLRLTSFSESVPVTKTAAIQPIRKPVVGVVKMERPPRPPESTGRPMAAIRIVRRTASVPRFAPRTTPASMTPSDCAVIGTGMKPSVIGGRSPSAMMMAENSEISTRSRVVMTLKTPDGYLAASFGL
ncbi:hypothetical protein D3C72_1118810 [compost metagenome]